MIIKVGTIVTMDSENSVVRSGYIWSEDGLIKEIGSGPPPRIEAELIDLGNHIVIPGFIDTHTHLWNGLWRSYVGSYGPQSTYPSLGTTIGPAITPEEQKVAVLAAAAEFLDAGITTVHNWAHNMVSYDHAAAELAGMTEAGIRGRLSYGYHWSMDPGVPMDVSNAVKLRGQNSSSLIDFGVALRNDTTADPEFTRLFPSLSVPVPVLAEEIAESRRNGLPTTMHILTKGPASYYIDAGYVTADNLIAHGYFWRGDEWIELAHHDVRISVSPYSAIKGQRVVAPIADALDAQAVVSLSHDHMNRSGRADMFRLMDTTMSGAALGGGEALTFLQTLRLATLDGARALNLEDKVGSLEPGKHADLVAIRKNSLSLTPVFDPVTTVVNSAANSDIDWVIIDGVVKKKNGTLVDLDRAALASAAQNTMEGLVTRLL